VREQAEERACASIVGRCRGLGGRHCRSADRLGIVTTADGLVAVTVVPSSTSTARAGAARGWEEPRRPRLEARAAGRDRARLKMGVD
jgi:hypothetical protein